MPHSIGIPVVSAKIVTGDAEFAVAIDDEVTITVAGAADTVVTGTVKAMELTSKPFCGMRETAVYDNVATSQYDNPVCAMIRNAADVFEVEAVLVEVPGATADDPVTHTRIAVSTIKAIAAKAADPNP